MKTAPVVPAAIAIVRRSDARTWSAERLVGDGTAVTMTVCWPLISVVKDVRIMPGSNVKLALSVDTFASAGTTAVVPSVMVSLPIPLPGPLLVDVMDVVVSSSLVVPVVLELLDVRELVGVEVGVVVSVTVLGSLVGVGVDDVELDGGGGGSV